MKFSSNSPVSHEILFENFDRRMDDEWKHGQTKTWGLPKTWGQPSAQIEVHQFVHFPSKQTDGWIDNLRFYILFNSISVIIRMMGR